MFNVSHVFNPQVRFNCGVKVVKEETVLVS